VFATSDHDRPWPSPSVTSACAGSSACSDPLRGPRRTRTTSSSSTCSIDKRLLEDPSQDDGVTALWLPSQGSSGPSQLVQRHKEDRPMPFGGSGL
jgi:hypothetical protein